MWLIPRRLGRIQGMNHHIWTLTYRPHNLRKVDTHDLLGADAGLPSKGTRVPEPLTLGQRPEGVDSLADAQLYLEEHLEEGTSCPCCGQRAELHRWAIKPKQAAGLLLLAWFSRENPEHGQKFIHITRFFAALGLPPRISTLLPTDFPKLRHWGLLEEGDRGFYRLTKLGLDFVRGEATVPECILTYNDTFLGYSGKSVDIYTALGEVFDLAAFEYEAYLVEITSAMHLDTLADLEARVQRHPRASELLEAVNLQLDSLVAIAA